MFRKTTSVILSVIMILCFAGCKQDKKENDSNKREDKYSVKYSKDIPVTIRNDGVAVFDNGTVSYSWDTNEWNYELKNGLPVVYKNYNGLRYSFAVFAYNDGMVDDLSKYALNSTAKFWGKTSDDMLGKMSAGGPTDKFSSMGCSTFRTGFAIIDYHSENSTYDKIGVVYSLSNVKHSAVISVYAEGTSNAIKKLDEENYAGGIDNGIIIKPAEDIIESFSLKNQSLSCGGA